MPPRTDCVFSIMSPIPWSLRVDSRRLPKVVPRHAVECSPAVSFDSRRLHLQHIEASMLDSTKQQGAGMLSDYQYGGKKGSSWVKFDELPDGIRATAAGPITAPGGFVGDVAAVVAVSDVEAERLLLEKLRELGA